MTNPVLVPLHEYLSSDYSPDCDYVDGQIMERNVGEWEHSRLQALLIHHLLQREKEWGIIVVTEQRVRVSETRYRIPDILILTEHPDEQIVTRPPYVCIEILSPEDLVTRMTAKITNYLDFRVNYVWVIDLKTRTSVVYTSAGVQQIAKGGALLTSRFSVSLADLE